MRQIHNNSILVRLIDELRLSIELTRTVPRDLYVSAENENGSIGAHIRHNLDHVVALTSGVLIGRVDYADRERNRRTENDQRYAEWKIWSAIASLKERETLDPATLLSVRSELNVGSRHMSSFSRELEFVYSHMVHHHALIGERLARWGVTPPCGLGIAPSTQAYLDRIKTAA